MLVRDDLRGKIFATPLIIDLGKLALEDVIEVQDGNEVYFEFLNAGYI